jgi:peptide/nickel transport system substrate-binding protein
MVSTPPRGPTLGRQVNTIRAEGDFPRLGGTLRLLGPGGADHLDTASAYYATSGQILRALARQLFAYPAAADLSDARAVFTPAPDVAAEVPTLANGGLSPDRRVYTIRLRPGVRWDTSPPRDVTALDFVRGLKRLANPVAGAGARHYFTSTIAGMRAYCDAYDRAFAGRQPDPAELAAFQRDHDVPGLRAPDDRTLVLSLDRPANDFLNILAMGFASAVPVEYDAYLPDSHELRRSFVSNGPYRVARYAPDDLLLERNPAWRQDADPIRGQSVDAIHVRTVKKAPDAVRALIDAGEIDLAWSVTVVSWAKPSPERESVPRSYPGYALNPYLVFNLRSPNQRAAVQDLRVRQAVAYAVDRVAIGQIFAALDGVAIQPLHSAIPPGNIGHRAFNPYPTPGDRGDADRARDLLAQAGFPDGLTLVAAVRDAGLHLDVMRSVARDLDRCGVRLRLDTYSQAEYYGSLLSDPDRGRAGAWDIAEPGWTPDWFGNNGRTIVQPLFQSNDAPGTTNYGGYANPAVDALIPRALEAPDPDSADRLWHDVDALVMRDLPIVPLLSFACQSCTGRIAGAGCGTWSPPFP